MIRPASVRSPRDLQVWLLGVEFENLGLSSTEMLFESIDRAAASLIST